MPSGFFSPRVLRPWIGLLVLAAALAAMGCGALRKQTKVHDPRYARARWPTDLPLGLGRPGVPFHWESELESRRLEFERSPTVEQADRLAKSTYAAAHRLDGQQDARAVDLYYESLTFSGYALARGDFRRREEERLRQMQCDSLARLIDSGQRMGRLNPTCLLQVKARCGSLNIPIRHVGFSWSANDFERLVVYGHYRDNRLTRKYQRPGVGLPLIALSRSQAQLQHLFVPPGMPFSATALMEPPIETVARVAAVHPTVVHPPVLTLLNPLTVETIAGPRGPRALAGDFSVALTQQYKLDSYNPLLAFLGDSGVSQPRLIFLEPYQAGKIPVVFIHGLLSAPSTFVDMANELRADPILRHRYQIWAFRYPTGAPFLTSAADLRSRLHSAFVHANQVQPSPANDRAVLIGHSMGGLLAKLQVTSSGDRIWRSVANAPFETLQAHDQARQRLAEAVFFEPVSQVDRIILIATPHLGSDLANSLPGRVGRNLAKSKSDEAPQARQLHRANPGLFRGQFSEGFPSSIDLLEPGNSVLAAVQCLPYQRGVHVHAIFGDLVWTPRAGYSDGVVSAESALAAPWETMAPVRASHTSIQHHEATFDEVRCLLRVHLNHGSVAP